MRDMAGYTKLFSSILASTIWREDDKTRIVWITLLAMSDKHGMAEGSLPGLADLARVSIDECKTALDKLSSPDEYSRSQEFDGRRIQAVAGGWHLLNHGKYREKMNADERREYNRKKQEDWRAKHRQRLSNGVNDSQSQSALSAHTEAAPDTKAILPPTPCSAKPNGVDAESISLLIYLNEKAEKRFRTIPTNLKLIRARLSEKDITPEGCREMIDRQVALWKGERMEEYLRPATLFGKEKFAGYYDSRLLPITVNGEPARVERGLHGAIRLV